ncbi:hypothetical protein JHK86_045349 [Glycine max]|nr:hypothetical protein JHK86_045349 [Glycine max]
MDVLLELAASLNSSLNVQLQNSQQYISAKNFISSTFNASLVVSLDPCIMPLDEVSFGLEVDLVAAFSNVATIIMPVTPLVSLLTHTPAPDMHRPVNNNFHHVSSGMPLALNTQSQQDIFGI